MLPSTLVPDNGNSRRYIPTRLLSLDDQPTDPAPSAVPGAPRRQLGLTSAGVRADHHLPPRRRDRRLRESPRLNVPLAVMPTTMLVIGTHFRMVARYYFQVTPLIVFFVTMLLVYAAGARPAVARRRPRADVLVACSPPRRSSGSRCHASSAPPGRRRPALQRLRRRPERARPRSRTSAMDAIDHTPGPTTSSSTTGPAR